MRRENLSVLLPLVVGVALLFVSVLLRFSDPADAQVIQPGASGSSPATFVTQLQTTVDPGLAGTSNSIGYRVAEVERHLHSRERWFGKLAVQTATDWADNTLTPYRAISGAGAYGTDPNDEALVLGTADSPAIAGTVRFDFHKLMVINASQDTVYKLRIVYGSGTMAAAIAAGQFSETMFRMDPAASQVPHMAIPVQMPRGTSGATQVWIQAWNATNNATVDFVIGLHEYEG